MFLAFAICKVGVEAVSSSMDAVQPKIMLMILQQVRGGGRAPQGWVGDCDELIKHIHHPLPAVAAAMGSHTISISRCINQGLLPPRPH